MRLDAKDAAGVAVILCTLGVVAVHNGPFGHPDGHRAGVADAGGSVTSAVGEPTTAFVDFNVVPMDRDVVLPHQVVVVRGGFIQQIGPVGTVEPPRGANIIEGNGTGYLSPGLTDAHVHLRGRYDSWLPLFVANGVTTVFNLEGRPGHLALKRRILEGTQEGPMVYTSGPYVGDPQVRTPADARTTVARQAARGYDFVKVHGDLSAEAYRMLTEAGRELDIPVVGHAPRNLPFASVVENRQVALSHAEEIIQTELRNLDPEALTDVAKDMVEAGTWLIPTMAHFESVADQWGTPSAVDAALQRETSAYLPSWLRDEWRSGENPFLGLDAADRIRLAEMSDFHGPLVRELHAAGVPMLAGTDTPIPTLAPGFSLRLEIEALRSTGMSGYDALATATSNPGRFVRRYVDAGARFGTLERGSRADIIWLDGDPRLDAETLRRPVGVMVRGRWYDRSDLDKMLERVAASR
ncbi:MAG: amidohydrolase family protein [Gemmatimonadota bacterium]|nr:amidohydrolase family protein [Gemmatimonadota bacterium]